MKPAKCYQSTWAKVKGQPLQRALAVRSHPHHSFHILGLMTAGKASGYDVTR